jgi:hypothetical protein
MDLQVQHIYDITKLCKQQTEVIENYESANIHDIGKSEARQGKYEKLKLGRDHAYDRSCDEAAVVT